jgi:hypothetical protein
MKEDTPHHCRNCDDFPIVDMPGKPIKWIRPSGTFICTTCGEHISKDHIPLHICKKKINAMFIPLHYGIPAEND